MYRSVAVLGLCSLVHLGSFTGCNSNDSTSKAVSESGEEVGFSEFIDYGEPIEITATSVPDSSPTVVLTD